MSSQIKKELLYESIRTRVSTRHSLMLSAKVPPTRPLGIVNL
ncbi:unnamed protein product [Arabidopsis lyrata]|nr:unnamed protein product [Arabidopsis lyrata]